MNPYYSDHRYQPRADVVAGQLDQAILHKLNTNTTYSLLNMLKLDEFERLFVLASREEIFLTIFETRLFGKAIQARRFEMRRKLAA